MMPAHTGHGGLMKTDSTPAGIVRGAAFALLLALGGCGDGGGDANGLVAAPEAPAADSPAPSEAMPAGLPEYPGAQSLRIRDMEYARGMPPLPFATFRTTDSPAQVADFYVAAAGRAGFELMQRRDNAATVQLTFRNELHRLTINSQSRSDGMTSTQIGLAVRPDRREPTAAGN